MYTIMRPTHRRPKDDTYYTLDFPGNADDMHNARPLATAVVSVIVFSILDIVVFCLKE